MGYATYLTASPFTSDKYFRTEAQADARITAAAAESPPVVLSKTGDITIPDNVELGRWVWDSTNSEFQPLDTSETEERREWKYSLGELANVLDSGLHSHWLQAGKTDSKFEEAGTVTAAQKLNNTFDWGRQSIGLAWLEIRKLEGDATALGLALGNSETAARTHAQVRTDVETFSGEFLGKGPRPVSFWYEAHSTPAVWRAYLDSRTVWVTNADGTGARYGGSRYASIPEATWQQIVNTYYHEALRWGLGIGVS